MKYKVITSSQSLDFNSMAEALNYINLNKIYNFKIIRG